jgi:hypothetical protein
MNGYPKRASRPSRSQERSGIVLDLPTVRKMLPLVRHIVGDLLDVEQKLTALLWEQEGLDRNRRTLTWPERQRRYFILDEVTRNEQRRKGAVAELKELGVIVLDAAHGRVGFPTIVNTKPAFFSWRPGEEEVGFWHFAGDDDRRRPIPVSWTKEASLASFPRK